MLKEDTALIPVAVGNILNSLVTTIFMGKLLTVTQMLVQMCGVEINIAPIAGSAEQM